MHRRKQSSTSNIKEKKRRGTFSLSIYLRTEKKERRTKSFYNETAIDNHNNFSRLYSKEKKIVFLHFSFSLSFSLNYQSNYFSPIFLTELIHRSNRFFSFEFRRSNVPECHTFNSDLLFLGQKFSSSSLTTRSQHFFLLVRVCTNKIFSLRNSLLGIKEYQSAFNVAYNTNQRKVLVKLIDLLIDIIIFDRCHKLV